ncbi:MAG TPA: hypothetical protein VJM11_17280 [Nevskiaceae bacterium]|nr:hypothetical protein [Nevskiaceae bacterium]
MPKLIGNDDPDDDSRRSFLVSALSTGLLVGGLGWNHAALAQLFGRVPRKLPEGRSIFEIRGQVLVNGAPATRDTVLAATDRIETADGGYLVAAVGDTAFLLRERSALQLDGTTLVRSLRMLTGRMLCVFGKRASTDFARIETVVSTIGVRGTGLYAEASAEATYLCTCYGTTTIAAADDASISETVTTRHHDAPRYVLPKGAPGRRIVPAPFINHTDLELMTLEAIVGREVPFAASGNEYDGPSRDY